MIKKFFMKKIDNYIIKHHSQNYIRREMITEEIKKRIEKALKRNNKIRDLQEQKKTEAQKLEFDIQESGWVAEISKLEKDMVSIFKFRDETLELYYKTYERARELALITAENEHEGRKIIKSIGGSVGRLEIIGRNTGEVLKEIEKNKSNDEKTLKIDVLG